MRDIKKILELRAQGRSQRFISQALKVSRNSISKIYGYADQKKIQWDSIKEMTEKEVEDLLIPKETIPLEYCLPNFDYIHKELMKTGVTLRLLWEEYMVDCRNQSKPFYQQSQFNKLYRDYVNKNRLTMHINHKPGDKLMVDWNGKVMYVTDRYTGELFTAYIFVATLPFSMYTYIQSCPSMDIKNWIECHTNAYKFFGGVTRLLVPDNCKTATISNKKYEDPVLNKSYQEMADHVGTTIVPARVRSPKDKAAVEGSVGNITTEIMARLRNRTFFSFEELNKALLIELDKFNNNPFQKKEGSRKYVYLEEEKGFMLPLPEYDFELSEWKIATVQLNYHIRIEKMNYSVPYEYVGKRVEVKITKKLITIYYKKTQICEHKRIYGRKNQYSTNDDHMPENHKLFKWNGERFRKWALSIGPSTYGIIDEKLKQYKIEEQAYKGCLSILKLADKYSAARLENACRLASEHISKPGYKNIRLILQSGQDMKKIDKNLKSETEDYEYACVRGGNYYGNK